MLKKTKVEARNAASFCLLLTNAFCLSLQQRQILLERGMKHSLQGCGNLSLPKCFKIVRLMAIRNGLKWIIFTSSGLGLLPMVLEPNTGRCASEDTGPQGGGLWDPALVREGNETIFIRVWKPLPGRRVLKLWGWRRRNGPKRTNLLVVGLGCYKWYQS